MINFKEFKRFFIFTSIGALIVSALVAVVAVLLGEFNDIMWRVFETLFMVILHSFVALAFIWDDSRNNTFTKLSFFINTVFVLVVMSFVTSLFGIWQLLDGEIVWHCYQTFFLVAFASLHGDMLAKATKREKYIDYVIFANYIFIVLVVMIFLPIIFTDDALRVLGAFYFRVLAATGIIDGTLSILTIIFYKLYMHRHPEAVRPGDAVWSGVGIWLWIIMIYIAMQFVIPIFFLSAWWR
jgi:hypothetical protein